MSKTIVHWPNIRTTATAAAQALVVATAVKHILLFISEGFVLCQEQKKKEKRESFEKYQVCFKLNRKLSKTKRMRYSFEFMLFVFSRCISSEYVCVWWLLAEQDVHLCTECEWVSEWVRDWKWASEGVTRWKTNKQIINRF